MNYLIIPDIHGQISQYEQIEHLIKSVLNKDSNVHIIFLGDYIDRGEDNIYEYYDKNKNIYIKKYFSDIGSRKVVEKLFEMKDYFIKYNIKYTFLRGNHEENFIYNIKNLESFGAKKNKDSSKDYIDMYQTILGFTQDFNLMNKTKSFFNSMPYYYKDEKNKIFFVHAGINPHKNILQNSAQEYLNIRDKFYNYSKTFSYKIIFGHTPIDSILNSKYVHDKYQIIYAKDRIGIDSGNYRNGYINILRIYNNKYTISEITNEGIRKSYEL